MVPIYRHRKFNKQFKRLSKKMQDRFEQKLMIFLADPYSVELNNHPLTGEWLGHRSIDVTGDVRAIFRVEDSIILFVAVGSHSRLYKK